MRLGLLAKKARGTRPRVSEAVARIVSDGFLEVLEENANEASRYRFLFPEVAVVFDSRAVPRRNTRRSVGEHRGVPSRNTVPIREPKEEPKTNSAAGAAKERAPRPRDELFEAIVEVCDGYELEHLTEDERGRANRAHRQLVAVEATPRLVRLFADHYRAAYDDSILTPQAITGNWSAFRRGVLLEKATARAERERRRSRRAG